MTTQRDNITKSRIDLDIRAAITDQLNAYGGSCSAAEICRYLNVQEEFVGRVPQLRSIQRIVKEYRDQHPVEEWHWSQYPAEDARILLDVMAVLDNMRDLGRDESYAPYYPDVIDPETGDSIGIDADLSLRLRIPDDYRLTKRFAEWAIKISKVSPGISSISLFQLARYYLLTFDLNLTTEGLDGVLAMRPWQNSHYLWMYVRKVGLGERPKISVPGGHLGVLLSFHSDVFGQDRDEPDSRDIDFHQDGYLARRHSEISQFIWEALK